MNEKQITEVTRRNISDALVLNMVNWAGRFEEQQFLARLYDVSAMPSTDRRYSTASEDIYQTEDGRTRIQVRLQDETVWLTQQQMAELFQRERSVITKHIRNIFEEGELVEEAVCANFARTGATG